MTGGAIYSTLDRQWSMVTYPATRNSSVSLKEIRACDTTKTWCQIRAKVKMINPDAISRHHLAAQTTPKYRVTTNQRKCQETDDSD